MEILKSLIGVPYVFHCLTVSGVLLGAILLFVFGFKSAEEPSFNKLKSDSKSSKQKKKQKDKKNVTGSPNSSDAKSKSNANVKVKTPKNEEKVKKINALKDSKTVNINAKPVKKETPKNENKKKGKENIDSQFDFSDDEGGWEQAISRKDKKNKKLQNGLKEGNVKQSNKDSAKSPKGDKKGKENLKNQSQNDKKQKYIDLDDSGVWQEAKSSKKRRKVQKEA